ncbi:hypothetical protein CO2235_140131 [Cupriavidus oxalaticus]|uniref:Uncharacterized protein n=1 Tax=Cupriavidus oxalaticus TaxID=96344 RepID=A0A375FMF8_9BURK|nr:hypothetical protein CO2235_U600129 [Cupriavidus oxalaticus]SPC12330.1 hypothetical protein CO2235_140131 [Cupriavidus oxalaticus]
MIVGKSLRDQDGGHSFAYGHKLERRPADRMWNFLLREGVQSSQPVTFLSDGGDTVRFAQLGFGDRCEYVLDWFHISMRVQNLEQMIKGRPAPVRTVVWEGPGREARPYPDYAGIGLPKTPDGRHRKSASCRRRSPPTGLERSSR